MNKLGVKQRRKGDGTVRAREERRHSALRRQEDKHKNEHVT